MKNLLKPLVATFVLVGCGEPLTSDPANSTSSLSSMSSDGTSGPTGSGPTGSGQTGSGQTGAPSSGTSSAVTPTSAAATSSGGSGPTSTANSTSSTGGTASTASSTTSTATASETSSTQSAVESSTTGTDSAAGTSDSVTSGTASTVCPYVAPETAPEGQDWVGAAELLEFNDNGGWCWYQDERVIVDEEAGQMIIGSVASGGGRESNVEITHWDIAAKTGERHHVGTMKYTDDHDVPAIIKRPEGGYAAMWAGHNDDCNSYYSVYDGTKWSDDAAFAWPSSGCPTSSGKSITYANMWYMGDSLISYVRSLDTSPHYLESTNGGMSWTLTGRLTSTPQVGYVAGYYKYWGNNTDRLDFFGTEAHPRDNDNSLYHGYIKDGKIHNSNGEVVDDNFSDMSAEEVTQYTKVFATGSTINGVKLEHMWNADLMRYDDGTVVAIGSGRVSGTGSDDPDKRLLYFRFDGTEWKTTYLARAGTKLYSSEQDYTGLGAVHPDNPNVIYISTSYDPRSDTGQNNGKKEIWKGVTCDGGATFDWEPITANSQMDNLRPVVPKWDVNHTALLWLRGTYSSAQSYNLKVVGFIEEH